MIRLKQNGIKESLTSYIEELPALPTSISRIMEICNDPASSPADLSRIISLDPVLMGRVMKLINSAYYGLNNQVTSLVRAIIMLGLNTVKNLALSTAVMGTIGIKDSPALNMEEFWKHSLCVGVTAKLIAQKTGQPVKELEEFFIAGLLHDIGKIPLNNKFPREYAKTIKYADSENFPLYEGEQRLLGCDHTEMGQMIASSWNLSEGLCHAVSHHHGDYVGPHMLQVYTVCVANYFAHKLDKGYSGEKHPREPGREVFDYLEIDWDDLENMEAEVEEAIDRAKDFLRMAG